MQGGAGLRLLVDTVSKTIAAAAARQNTECADSALSLKQSLQRFSAVTARLHSAPALEITLANSSVYLEATGHIVIAWIWLEQMLLATEKDEDFYQGKMQAGRFFFKWELPKVAPMLDLLDSLDTTTLTMKDAWF